MVTSPEVSATNFGSPWQYLWKRVDGYRRDDYPGTLPSKYDRSTSEIRPPSHRSWEGLRLVGGTRETRYNVPEKVVPGRKIDVKDLEWISDLHGMANYVSFTFGQGEQST